MPRGLSELTCQVKITRGEIWNCEIMRHAALLEMKTLCQMTLLIFALNQIGCIMSWECIMVISCY